MTVDVRVVDGAATRDVFSAEELAQLRSFPEINRTELIRHFTLTGAKEAFERRFRTGRKVLGAAVQLCTLPWLGFVPDEVPSAPAAAVGRLSQRLGVPMGKLRRLDGHAVAFELADYFGDGVGHHRGGVGRVRVPGR